MEDHAARRMVTGDEWDGDGVDGGTEEDVQG
jgi:hypothetical protein